jgi:hypothetical protein
MTQQEILQRLTDDAEYYGKFGKQYLSNSDIGTLLRNPSQYGVSREDNKAFAEGRYFHQLLIEPDKAKDVLFVDVSTRTTKEYKSFIEANNLQFCLLKKEKEEVEALVLKMRGNIAFFDEIYRDGNQYEVPAIKEIKGKMWKGKTDIMTNDILIDLKTTSDIHKFKYSAKAYNYDSQAYIYQQLFDRPLVFYVVDKVSGQLGIFTPTENFIKGGELKVEKAVEIYDRYFGENPSDDIDNYFINEILD